jgi:HTH-type transcriptional regulator, competence development regulator
MEPSFGELLRQKRRAAEISQRRLAELAGLDFSYISKLENNRLAPPAAETVLKLAELLGCPAEELLSAAGKLPGEVGQNLASSPAAVRFVREASALGLTTDEWEKMRGMLLGLREEEDRRGQK